MSEEKGIESLKKLINAIEIVGVEFAQIMEDGKVGIDDLDDAIELLGKSGVLMDAVKGFSEATKEAKDLDQSEVIELIGELYKAAKAIEEAA